MWAAFFRKDFWMDVDITCDIKKYAGRFGIALCFLIVCIAYVMTQINQNNRAGLIAEGCLMHRMENILSPGGGTVEDVVVQEGSVVEVGTVLTVIRNKLSEDDLLRLQQNAELAKRNLAQLQNGSIASIQTDIHANENNPELLEAQTRMERMKALYEMGAISAAKRDEAVASYEMIKNAAPSSSSIPTRITVDAASIEAAQRQVKTAEDALKNATEGGDVVNVISSSTGMITSLSVLPGDYVQTGDILLQMQLTENPWIETDIAGDEIDKIYIGQLVEYRLDRTKLNGTVQEISDIEGEGGDKRVVISVPTNITDLRRDTERIKLRFIQ
jgi:multidrug resistance efflux pump